MLRLALDQAMATQAQPDYPEKILETDCEESYADVDADINSWGSPAVQVHGDAEFTAEGTCTAYATAFAYYWDPVAGANSESDNSGGYTDSIDIHVNASGEGNPEHCYYATALMLFNAGRSPLYPPTYENPADCYCPQCSSPDP